MYKLIVLAMIAASIAATQTAACPADEYCRSCSSTKCSLCSSSYADSNGICQLPTTSVSNCVAYSSATVCSACDYGYYLNSNACTAIAITNCEIVTASAPTTCTACSGSVLVNSSGTCTSGATCTLSNCDICYTNTNCAMCDSNYSLTVSATAATCVAEPTNDCFMVASSSSSTCGACDSGYYYATGAACTSSSVQDNAAIFSAVVALFAFIKLVA